MVFPGFSWIATNWRNAMWSKLISSLKKEKLHYLWIQRHSSMCTHRASGSLGIWGWERLLFLPLFPNVINRLQLAEKCNLHYKPFRPRFGPSFCPVRLGLPIPSLSSNLREGLGQEQGERVSTNQPPFTWPLLVRSGFKCHPPETTRASWTSLGFAHRHVGFGISRCCTE